MPTIYANHTQKPQFLKSIIAASAAALLTSGFATADSADMDQDYVNPALQWAPADSFFVVGNTQSFGSEQGTLFLERQRNLYASMGDTYSELLKQVIANDISDMPDEVKPLFEGYLSVLDSAMGLLQNDDIWSNLDNGSQAMYFDGVIPVIRSEGHSAEVSEFYQSIINDKLPTPEKLTVDGVEILKFAIPAKELPFPVSVYLLTTENQTVISAFPDNFEDHYLQRNFIKPVISSAWSSGELVKMRDEYGYNGISEGYLNIERLADSVLFKKSENVEDPILQMAMMMVPSLEQIAPPGCAPLVEKVIESVPRFVFGYEESTKDSDVMSMTVEFSPEVAGSIQDISTDIPATQKIDNTIFEFGVGLNLLSLRETINSAASFLQEAGKGCELVDQEAIQQGLIGLNFAMNPMITQFTGVNVALSNFGFKEGSEEPDLQALEGVVVFDVEDTKSLMQLAPMIGLTVDVPEDGTPVELPEGLLPPEAPADILIARTNNQVALAVGEKAEEMIAAAFSDQEVDKDMLLRYELNLADMMKLLPKEIMEEAFKSTGNKEMLDQILKLYELMDETAVGLGFSDKGLKVTAEQSYNL